MVLPLCLMYTSTSVPGGGAATLGQLPPFYTYCTYILRYFYQYVISFVLASSGLFPSFYITVLYKYNHVSLLAFTPWFKGSQVYFYTLYITTCFIPSVGYVISVYYNV